MFSAICHLSYLTSSLKEYPHSKVIKYTIDHIVCDLHDMYTEYCELKIPTTPSVTIGNQATTFWRKSKEVNNETKSHFLSVCPSIFR